MRHLSCWSWQSLWSVLLSIACRVQMCGAADEADPGTVHTRVEIEHYIDCLTSSRGDGGKHIEGKRNSHPGESSRHSSEVDGLDLARFPGRCKNRVRHSEVLRRNSGTVEDGNVRIRSSAGPSSKRDKRQGTDVIG